MSFLYPGAVPGFRPMQSNITYDFDALTAPPRTFRTISAAADLGDAQRSLLEDFAAWRTPFPCANPKPGRTLHGVLDASAINEWPGISGVKAKGIAGLVPLLAGPENSMWMCFRPDPSQQYGQVAEVLFRLDNGLRVIPYKNDPKVLHSISTRRAKVEFTTQEALARAGLGQRGLLVGEFLQPDGAPLRDRYEQPIGAVFCGYDPRFVALSDLRALHLSEVDGELAFLERKQIPGCDWTGEAAWRGFLTVYPLLEHMGRAKVRAAVHAGVGRHNGHSGNFLFDPKTEDILVTDTDCCIELASLDPQLKGPQLLHDLAEDLYLLATEISVRGYTPTFLRKLADGDQRNNPFLPYLRGFFGEYLPSTDIQSFAAHLGQCYATFLEKRHDRFAALADRLRADHDPEVMRQVAMNWLVQHKPFLIDTIVVGYEMMRASRLPTLGFVLPSYESAALRRQTADGIMRMIGVLYEISNAFLRQNGLQPRIFDRAWYDL